MQNFILVFLAIFYCIGETLQNGTETRTGKQFFQGRHRPSQQFQIGNQPQFFQVTTPQHFVLGNQGHFQPVNHNQGSSQVPSFCQGSNINLPHCQQYTQAIGFPTGSQRPTNCKGRNKRRPECQGQNNSRPNCKGKKKNNPECLALTGGVNCKGKRKNRPECQAVIIPPGGGSAGNIPGSGGSVGGGNRPSSTDNAIKEAFSQIPWLQQLTNANNFVSLPGLPKAPQSTAQSRFYQLALGARDDPFQQCMTPRRQGGHCRYIQHCILPEFVSNFRVFLRYVCFIQGVYVGVCCPDSRYPPIFTVPPPTPAITPRPPTPPTARGCGVNSLSQTKIVGGREAQLNKYPWAAALLRGTESSQYCGGALITSRHVLTAAHCVDGFTVSSITVRLGEYSFDDPQETPHRDFKLSSIKKHERYDTTTYENDLAILSLDRTTDFSNSIWSICIPSGNTNYAGQTATVIGWGTIYFGGPISPVLREVSIPVWDNNECDAAYEKNKVFNVNMCAGDKDGGKDSCQGDSGGPLMIQEGGRWTLIGVVSWGIRCADPGIPGVYARVSEFRNWIGQNT